MREIGASVPRLPAASCSGRGPVGRDRRRLATPRPRAPRWCRHAHRPAHADHRGPGGLRRSCWSCSPYDGRHLVGAGLAEQLVEAAKRSIGHHDGAVYDVQARHLCQDLVLWRRRLAEIERYIADLLDRHEVGKLLTTIDGIGPQSAAAAYVGVVPGLSSSPAPAPPSHPSATPACAGRCGCPSSAPCAATRGCAPATNRLRANGKPAQARPHRRHAQAAPRRPQRRQGIKHPSPAPCRNSGARRSPSTTQPRAPAER